MSSKPNFHQKVIQYLRQNKVVQTSEMTELFDCSKRTIFRILKIQGYLTSYNMNSSGITLTDIPKFDTSGLWEHQGYRFSRWGLLKKTIQSLVNNSKAGLSAKEVRHLLHHDNIYHHLTSSVDEGLIYRDSNWVFPIYYSIDKQKRRKQRKSREKMLQVTPSKIPHQFGKDTKPTETSSFEIEKVHFGFLAQLLLADTLTADDIYMVLKGMDKPIERKEIQEIVIRHNLYSKKTQLELLFLRKKIKNVESVTDD